MSKTKIKKIELKEYKTIVNTYIKEWNNNTDRFLAYITELDDGKIEYKLDLPFSDHCITYTFKNYKEIYDKLIN
jgi:hypothetical protein